MKTTIIMAIILMAYASNCAVFAQEKQTSTKIESDTLKSDSAEYELLIIEPGYEMYLATQPPKEFYSEWYYKNWNMQYVLEYNQRYLYGPRRDIYENEINYDQSIDYGLDLEYQLYYYFRFFEKKYGVTLINRGR